MAAIDVKQTVAKWLESVVIGLNLCPFAKREVMNDRVHYAVSEARDSELLINDLVAELLRLVNDDSIETTLLIHPHVLQDFADYNQFLAVADAVLVQLELDDVIQIASFHPSYQFAGTLPEDVENTTNQSPYPLLHLLREHSLDTAIEHHPNTDLIPQQNIDRVERLGSESMAALLQSCLVAKAE